jgi:hypothetical protein
MRILVVLGLLVVVIAAFVVTRFLGETTLQAPPMPGAPDALPAGARSSPAPSLPEGTVAAHAQRQPVMADDLAAEPTACLQVLDRASAQPVAGAAVRRVRDGAEIGFTDERGLADVPLRGFEQLAVVAEGYLLRLAPTRPGSTAAEPQRVQLVPDRWSPRVRLQLQDGSEAPVHDALVRFRPADAAPGRGVTAVPVPADDAVLQRAWTEHTMLAGRPVCGDVAVELGVFAPDRVHRIDQGAEVRFVVPGTYTVEVATLTGLVARRQIEVTAASARTPLTVTVQLQPGFEVAGIVQEEANGAPLAGTQVSLQGGDPLGLTATTAADGSFRLGPLLPGTMTLHVRHGDHEPRAVEVSAPAADVRIALQPLPQSVLRGRVRRRPDLAPIAGAVVAWQPNGAMAVAARTAADGTFLLRATGTAAARLAIQAPGCRAYAELVTPGTPFADYDVWPDTTALRLEHRLTAVLAGVVFGADGTPQPSVAVRWHPARPTLPAGMPGRRVLEGAGLDLPLVTTTAADGSFTLETEQLGAGRLTLAEVADVGETAGASIEVEAIAGTTTNGLRLRR